MDWFKIKNKHLSRSYTLANLGALLRFQSLVSILERHPTREEMLMEIPSRHLVALELALGKTGVDLELISSKVLEDVEQVTSKREAGKQRKRKQRDLGKMSRVTVLPSHATDKRRLEESIVDKRREDKNTIPDEFINALSLFEGKTVKTANWIVFTRHKDWKECLPLLVPAICAEKEWRREAGLRADYNFIPHWKNFATWLNQRCWEQEHPKVKGAYDAILG